MAEFTNRATLTYNNTRTLSNMTTGFLSESLTADKNSLQQSYSAGDRITYVVSLINSGQTDYEDLTVTDDLGAFTPTGGTTPVYPLTYDDGSAALYVDGAVQTPPVPQTTEPLVFTGISVPAGGNAVLDTVLADGFLADVRAKGEYFRKKLAEIPEVEGVDGLGLMLGIALKGIAPKDIAQKCVGNGLLILTAGSDALRLLPPLVITEEELKQGLDIIASSAAEIMSKEITK